MTTPTHTPPVYSFPYPEGPFDLGLDDVNVNEGNFSTPSLPTFSPNRSQTSVQQRTPENPLYKDPRYEQLTEDYTSENPLSPPRANPGNLNSTREEKTDEKTKGCFAAFLECLGCRK